MVPGFKDRANLSGEARKDAPTGCCLSQHLLLSLLDWHGKQWAMLSADVKAAFLKGDPFVARELCISGTNGKTSPSIPIADGCLAIIGPLAFATAYSDLPMREANGGSGSQGHLNPAHGKEIHLTKPPGFCETIL